MISRIDHLGHEQKNYETIDEAGKAAGKDAAKQSNDFDVKSNQDRTGVIPWKKEFAGLICCKDQKFRYTPPHPGLTNGPFPKNGGVNARQYDWSPNGAALGAASASSNPDVDYSKDENGETVTCKSVFEDDSVEVGYFHSHPYQSGANPSKKDNDNPKPGRKFLGWVINRDGVVDAREY